MKFLSVSLIAVLSIACLFTSESKVEWLTPLEHDFGDLLQGNPGTAYFKFKNTSGEAFLIDNVRTTCGCTAPDWSFDPIEADSTSQIRIVFDAARRGYFQKKIRVYFSGQRKAEILSIEGFVE